MKADVRINPVVGQIPDDIATILKSLRQLRDLSAHNNYHMLNYILRMAEAEAADLASSGMDARTI